MTNIATQNQYLDDVKNAAAHVCSMAQAAILRGYDHEVYLSDGSYEHRLTVAEDELMALVARRRRMREREKEASGD